MRLAAAELTTARMSVLKPHYVSSVVFRFFVNRRLNHEFNNCMAASAMYCAGLPRITPVSFGFASSCKDMKREDVRMLISQSMNENGMHATVSIVLLRAYF